MQPVLLNMTVTVSQEVANRQWQLTVSPFNARVTFFSKDFSLKFLYVLITLTLSVANFALIFTFLFEICISF